MPSPVAKVWCTPYSPRVEATAYVEATHQAVGNRRLGCECFVIPAEREARRLPDGPLTPQGGARQR
jgi:hypothetical protein